MTIVWVLLWPAPLAHAGPGSTWQAMVVVAGVVLAGVVVAAGLGLLGIASPDDLLLPLAAAAIASSLAVFGHEVLSDAIGWGLPLAVVSLLTLLLAALTPLELRFPGPLAMGALALALVSAISLYAPLTAALHPPADLLPLADDVELTIVEPADGSSLPGPAVEVVVEVAGGSLGPPGSTPDAASGDPEVAGTLSVLLSQLSDDGTVTEQRAVSPAYEQECTVVAPCTRVSFTVDLPPGQHRVTVEFLRGDGVPLAPAVRTRTDVTVD